MSKHDFTVAEFADRRTRVRQAITAAGLDWLVVIHPVSIHWLTGSDAKSYQEFQCLLISAAPGPLCVLTREGEVNEFRDDAFVDEVRGWGGGNSDDPLDAFARLASDYSLRDHRVGLETCVYYLHPHHHAGIVKLLGSALVAEPSQLISELKMVKSPQEIAYIREAAGFVDLAMGVFADSLAPGRTELELAGEVYRALLTAGSGLAASPINLVSGERSGFSHGAPTRRRLQRGDFGSIEYGATSHRYTATIGRQFSLGSPSARMVELYQVARDAADACAAEIRPGVPTVVAHRAACRVIQSAGLERGRVHTTGYGLAPGFPPTWGEPIHMMEGNPYSFRAGMVVTIEPPIFLGEERLGARLIDNVLITDNGIEWLTRFPRDLMDGRKGSS
jgi:Xaa-Pro dipeptidase